MAQQVKNSTSVHEDAGLILGSAHYVKDTAGCSIGCRCKLDLALLWLWCRPAAAAQILPPAWELPYAAGVALRRRGKKLTITTDIITEIFLMGIKCFLKVKKDDKGIIMI